MLGDNLGRAYPDRECIVRQGDEANTMFVVISGKVEVVRETDDGEVPLAVLQRGDIFGEMALFEKDTRSTTVRALGEARVMTLDKRTLLKRIKEDPLVAMNLIETLCQRIRKLSGDYAGLYPFAHPEKHPG